MKSETIALGAFALGSVYSRIDIASTGGVSPLPPIAGGIYQFANAVLLLVTLEKEEEYRDTFDGSLFHWQSQREQGQDAPVIARIEAGVPAHLFVRIRARDSRRETQPFVYCGLLQFRGMDGEYPVSVEFASVDFDLNTDSARLKQIYEWRSDAVVSEPDHDRRDEIQHRLATGQGRTQDPILRRKIELLGMASAEEHYRSLGFTDIRDTSKNHSYDLECRRGGEVLRVEVKATRGGAADVYVTAGEVRCASDPKFTTDLYILHSIRISRTTGTEEPIGGVKRIVASWRPEHEDLTPTEYRYRVPA